MNFKQLSFAKATKMADSYNQLSEVEFNELVEKWKRFEIAEDSLPSGYVSIRSSLVESFKAAVDECGGSCTDALIDVRVGLRLYQLLNKDIGFTVANANDDNVWRYLSMVVFPDITYCRYPNPAKGDGRINSKRFYAHTRRIWLKTVWWYVYLAWQGTEAATFRVLKKNGSNIISHFIERPGRGYRVQLFRDMMLAYSRRPDGDRTDKLFRSLTKMNVVKCRNMEPELAAGGGVRYSDEIMNGFVRQMEGRNDA